MLDLLTREELQTELLAAIMELDKKQDRIARLEAEVRFYDGLVIGDGDHDKIMLARDGDIFIRCMKLLGMDVSGTDVQEIVGAVESMKSKKQSLELKVKRLQEALEVEQE